MINFFDNIQTKIYKLSFRQAFEWNVSSGSLLILLCFSGSCEWYINSKRGIINTSDVLVVRNCGPLTLFGASAEDIQVGAIHTGSTEHWPSGTWLCSSSYNESDFDALNHCFSLLLGECASGKGQSYRISECVLDLLSLYLSRQLPNTTTRENPLVKAMRNAVLQRYDEPLSLNGIASELRVSATHLSALFHREAGMKFSVFLQNTRVQKAMHLLHDTEDLVLDIALKCGFGSAPHFNKVFRAHTGMNPLQYRKHSRT